MTRLYALALLAAALLAVPAALAQPEPIPRPNLQPDVRDYLAASARSGDPRLLFDPELRPFYHGVASGDPLADRVVLWTRVTPDEDGPVAVTWRIASDPELTDVLQTGTVTTDQGRDYTVKVDVAGLDAATTYFYGFTALDRNSLTGRTRTAPSGEADQLRFAIASCSNYQQGYFNAYARIGERADLDAVLHLGDYFYEYEVGVFASPEVDRDHEPDAETITLEDYRIRHSFYKLDPDLRSAHQQHPFITVWDDHESANDAWQGGAENHNEIVSIDTTFNDDGDVVSIDTTRADEGDWFVRKSVSAQAYAEWMPIRLPDADDAETIYRAISYGDLAELVMIDTRLEAREEQLAVKTVDGPAEVDTVAWFAEDRTLLGGEQLAWLQGRLSDSPARWRVVGNQVMMTKLAPHPLFGGDTAPFTNLDAWDGYPAERERVLGHLAANGIDNTVVLTGDIHSTWASDLPLDPFSTYDPTSGAGSLAVEFVTASVTADNLDEITGVPSDPSEAQLETIYPQLKDVELDSHGYFVLDLLDARAQADWFYSEILAPAATEVWARGWLTNDGENRIVEAAAPAAEKPSPPPLAPAAPPNPTSAEAGAPTDAALLVVGSYPNPASDRATIGYVLARPQALRVALYDVRGREVAVLLDAEQPAGVYTLHFDAAPLASGTYLYRFTADGRTVTRKMTVQR